MYNKLLDTVELYFESFSQKNIDSLSSIFDEKITLFDPIVKEIIGKDAVLKVNENIFDNCKSIKITKKDIFIDEKKLTAIAEIEFYCDNTKINVVDIIKFNNELKIMGITAYLDTGVTR